MFRERITRHYQALSPSFKRIADFILVAHQRAAFMSASRLAKEVGVDVATVTRFSQQLGYEGYVELSHEIQDAVLQEMSEARAPIQERLQEAEGPIARTLWRDWANLEKTIQNLPVDEVQKALDALRSARRIYFVSEGVGANLAQAARTFLLLLKPEVYLVSPGPFDMAMELKEAGPEDVVIGIGFTSYSYAATRALALARELGARTIGIIAQAECPISTESDLLFTCSITEEGYMPSPTCIMAILFSLVYSLYMEDVEAYSRKLMQFQHAYADLTEGTPRGDEDVVRDLMGLF